jgi:hypothetical protein
MAVEAFLRTHGPARGLAEGRILVAARKQAMTEAPESGPALGWAVWGELARLVEHLAAFEDLDACGFRPAKDLAGITVAIRALARTQGLLPTARPVVRDLVTPFG